MYISLMTKDVDHFLQRLSAILDSSIESSLFRSVLHFVNWILCSLDDQFLEFFVYCGDQTSVWCGVSEDLFPLCRPSFCLVGHVVCFTEAFQCQEVSCIHFVSLGVCATGVIFRKRSPMPMRSSAFDILISIIFYCGWSQLFELSNIFIVIICLSVSLFVVFQPRVSLCILVCPGTHFVDKTGLRLTEIHLPLAPSAGIKSMHWTLFFFKTEFK